MYTNLIDLLKKEIDGYEDNIKLLSTKIREIKPVYDVLKPNGKKFSTKNAAKLADDKELGNKMFEIIKKNNYIIVGHMLKNKIEFKKQAKVVDDKIRELIITKGKVSSSNGLMIVEASEYKDIISAKIENEKKLLELNKKIGMYVCTYIIEMYEKLVLEKEQKKQIMKNLQYALRSICKNVKLTPKDIAVITNIINNSIEDEIHLNNLLDELNLYISKTNKKEEIKIDTKQIITEEIKYVDQDTNDINKDKVIVNKKDEIYENYLTVLRSFRNINDVNTFLKSFGYTDEIKKIIYKILEKLSDSDEDKLLKQYLLNYIESYSSLSNDIASDLKEEITVLYYGFMDGKNRILNDIVKGNIPKDYYDDILKGIEMIENDGGIYKRENFAYIKKLFKLRVNDIRIIYRRLTDDLYVILGVFCKKDKKGYDIVKTSEKRNYNLYETENGLIEAQNISSLWDDILEKNEIIKEEIKGTLLKKKVKK